MKQLVLAHNKDKKLCQVKFCQKRAYVYVNKKSKKKTHSKLCCCHRRQHYKINNPIAYHYDYVKQNAKRRGIEWKLTRLEFKQFCEDTGYLKYRKTQLTANTKSFDRINPTLPYQIGNIQVVSLSYNSRKQAVDKMLAEKYGEGVYEEENYAERVDNIINGETDIF